MQELKPLPDAASKSEAYSLLARQAEALFEGERDFIANCANLASLLYWSLPTVNWCGVYLLRNGELVLGPFQGKVACTRIAVGSGVCGTSAQRRETVVVPDVHAFSGHIACDPASRSEVVVPLLHGDRVLGVLDIDSPEPERFDAEDAAGLETLGRLLLSSSDFE